VNDSPCATKPSTLLEDDEVPTVVPLDQINGRTHATDSSADDHDGGVGMIVISYRRLRPWLVSCHDCLCEWNVRNPDIDLTKSEGEVQKGNGKAAIEMDVEPRKGATVQLTSG